MAKKHTKSKPETVTLPNEPMVPLTGFEELDEPTFNPDEPSYGLPPDVHIQEVTLKKDEVIDWPAKFLNLPEIWLKHSGKGIKVAILDTGVDDKHPDLDGKIIAAKDFTGSTVGHRDRNDHGTWCAGAVSANADENGIRGVAYESKLIIAKVLGDQGSGQDNWIQRGMEWCNSQGADIFSLSLGGGRMSENLHRIFLSIAAQGKMIICAAGNDGGPINYPAAWADSCLSVGACDEQGRLTKFTSRGPTLGIVAPGQNMISTIPTLPGERQGRYGTMTGTSMACPVVAGITALALAAHRSAPGLQPLENITQLREIYRNTSTPISGGYGIINPSKLLDYVSPGVTPPIQPPVNPPVTGFPNITGYSGPHTVSLAGLNVVIYIGASGIA